VDLYYYGARYYDAMLGRFISVDKIRQYYNNYSYALNNPINFFDVGGFDARSVFVDAGGYLGEAAGSVLGAAIGQGALGPYGWIAGAALGNPLRNYYREMGRTTGGEVYDYGVGFYNDVKGGPEGIVSSLN
jgi:uncharacterized protein RhaS with RHS repeats